MSDDAAVWLDHHEKVVGALKAENAQLRKERDALLVELKRAQETRQDFRHQLVAAREALRTIGTGEVPWKDPAGTVWSSNLSGDLAAFARASLAASPTPTPAQGVPGSYWAGVPCLYEKAEECPDIDCSHNHESGEPCTCHFGCCAKCCGNPACPTHAKSARLSPGPSWCDHHCEWYTDASGARRCKVCNEVTQHCPDATGEPKP